MAKIYVQAAPCPWGYNGAVGSATCVTSGSFTTLGMARLTGIIHADEALDPASGLAVQQTVDGTNWDYVYKNTISASGGSAFSLEMVGEAARIYIWAASDTDATSVRTAWRLRPV